MKKVVLTALTIMGIGLVSYAQDAASKTPAKNYKAFKVDVGLGYAFPSGGGGTKAGVTFTVEPHYRLNDALALGLRFEGAALGYSSTSATGNSEVKVSVLNSYCATGEYYLKPSGFRPFVGAGAGIYTAASIAASTSTGGAAVVSPSLSKFGFFPRVGFETGHFRMSSEYNLVGSDVSYLAIKIGFFFGGGRK